LNSNIQNQISSIINASDLLSLSNTWINININTFNTSLPTSTTQTPTTANQLQSNNNTWTNNNTFQNTLALNGNLIVNSTTTITPTLLSYLSGLNSNIQSQISSINTSDLLSLANTWTNTNTLIMM
jgi:hypothetical protein